MDRSGRRGCRLPDGAPRLPRPRALVPAFAMALVGAMGCAPKYAPPTSRPVTHGSLVATAEWVETAPRVRGMTVRVGLATSEPVSLAFVRFAGVDTPCGAGYRPTSLLIDGTRVGVTRPVSLAGSHTIEARSRRLDDTTLLDHAFVDLYLGGPAGWRCLRVPVASESEPLVIAVRPVPFVRGEISGTFGDTAGVSSGLGGDVGTRLWLAPIRVGAGVGIRSVGCDATRCPEVTSDGATRNQRAPALVGSLEAATFPIAFGREAIGIGLEYQAAAAFLDAHEGATTQWLHTPRVIVHWASGHAGVSGLTDGPSPASFEVSVPVGLQLGALDGSTEAALTLGLVFGGMNML